MRKHTQIPSVPAKSGAYPVLQLIKKAETPGQAPQKQKRHSVFNLVKATNGKPVVICTDLTGEQATSLASALQDELNSPFLVKFASMEVTK